MELTQISNSSIFYGADGEFSITAGQELEIKIGGNELAEFVPDGKKWKVTISLKVEEENE